MINFAVIRYDYHIEMPRGVSVSLSFRKILNKTQIWQNKGDTIAVFKISLQTYYPSQNQINLAKAHIPIALY